MKRSTILTEKNRSRWAGIFAIVILLPVGLSALGLTSTHEHPDMPDVFLEKVDPQWENCIRDSTEMRYNVDAFVSLEHSNSPYPIYYKLTNDNVIQLSFGNVMNTVSIPPISNAAIGIRIFNNHFLFRFAYGHHQGYFKPFLDVEKID